MLKIESRPEYTVQSFTGSEVTIVPNVKTVTGTSVEIAPLLQYINQSYDTFSFFYTVMVTGNKLVDAQIELAFFGKDITNLDINTFAKKLNIQSGSYVSH
ncbi:hypothetical protein AB7X32_19290 [Morganella morganii]|uniref:hypothetical protein n=1 Tax=Morganella morganii TaxID=582 RepID=UPI0034E468A4